MQAFCRYAPSLGGLEGTPEEAWGTLPYSWKQRNEPTVFFGLYDLRDYLALGAHKGKKWVLWCGSDLRHLRSGFIANDGKLKWLSLLFRGKFTRLVRSVLKTAEHWVENETEKEALESLGIKVTGVCPSFIGNIHQFKITYTPKKNPAVYLSASEGRQEEYGFPVVERIARWTPSVRFHLYGANWKTKHKNVQVHGRVPKDQMNQEISKMQCGLRLNEFDGFSEILAKAVLMGQYAIGKVPHPYIPSYENDMELIMQLDALSYRPEPNAKARTWYLKNLNQYPWCSRA